MNRIQPFVVAHCHYIILFCIEIAPKSIINIYYYKHSTWIENYFNSMLMKSSRISMILDIDLEMLHSTDRFVQVPLHCIQCICTIEWIDTFVPNKYQNHKSIDKPMLIFGTIFFIRFFFFDNQQILSFHFLSHQKCNKLKACVEKF